MKLSGTLERDNVFVVDMHEENLDASNVLAFKEAAQLLLKDQVRVVLDLEGVRFIDSSGIGALLSCMRQVAQQRGEVRLCNLSGTVIALFELMRLNRVFRIYGSRADAVAF